MRGARAAGAMRSTTRALTLAVVLAALFSLAAPAAGQDEAPAEVSIDDQTTDGEAVLVGVARIPDGGFVVVHEEGSAPDEGVLGVSATLPAGYHTDVPVRLDEPVDDGQTVLAMLHKDTNGNDLFDHPEQAAQDPPYRRDGEPVADEATLSTGEDGLPGAGALAALAAAAGAALARSRS